MGCVGPRGPCGAEGKAGDAGGAKAPPKQPNAAIGFARASKPADHLEARSKMEPGGIEPPSRNGPPFASTRLFAGLISDPRRPATAYASPSRSVF